jgi:hypothetical protein
MGGFNDRYFRQFANKQEFFKRISDVKAGSYDCLPLELEVEEIDGRLSGECQDGR